jgi:DNA polymerase III delta subunit
VQVLADGLATPSQGSSLVLVESPAETVRKNLTPLRAACAVCVEASPPSERALIEWGLRKLTASGHKAEPGVLNRLLDACERDPIAFLNEAGKLAVLAGTGGTVTEAHVKTLTAPTLGSDLPEYLMAVASGDSRAATVRLERLLAEGENEGGVLWALGHLATSALSKSAPGYSWAKWGDATAALARRRDPASLARAVDAVYRAEAAWKGGRADARAALEQATREVAAR